MKNILKDNRGLTLVEMLISFAILSMMMVAVFAFMSNMTTQYQNSNNEVTVQNEVQTLMQQLENYIIDANVDVEWDGTNLYVMSDDEFCVITYDGSNQCLKYSGFETSDLSTDYTDAVTNKDKTSVYNAAKAICGSGTDLLAEYVETFKPTVYLSADENYVAIEIRIEKTNRSYTATKNIYLRNQIVTPTPTGSATATATPTPTT